LAKILFGFNELLFCITFLTLTIKYQDKYNILNTNRIKHFSHGSFARIHETNLKKQGMLALTFANPEDYNLIQEQDRIDIVDLHHFAPGIPLKLILNHIDGTSQEILAKHTYNDQQIIWFKRGSCLNYIKEGH